MKAEKSPGVFLGTWEVAKKHLKLHIQQLSSDHENSDFGNHFYEKVTFVTFCWKQWLLSDQVEKKATLIQKFMEFKKNVKFFVAKFNIVLKHGHVYLKAILGSFFNFLCCSKSWNLSLYTWLFGMRSF